ncbi:MAG: ankyrin repeat domain-containing protein [Nibricoccus sp.]
MKIQRRTFLAQSATLIASTAAPALYGQDTGKPMSTPSSAPPKDRVRPTHETALAAEFVAAAHRDLEKVKGMLAREPRLVFASVDTGNVGIGDWETGLNGAAHVGRRDIVEYLLSQGARIDTFCAAMLGYAETVVSLLKISPQAATVKGPHNLTLLYHVAISGEVAIAEAIKPHLPADAVDFNQALSAAARDGRAEMTEWLLTHGATNPNSPDGFRKTPLKIAVEKGFKDVAEILRKHGGRETL